MGKRGPAKKPAKLEILEGNPSKNKVVEPVKISDGFPKPPAFIKGEALKEWKRIEKELAHLNYIETIDIAAFAAYCQSYADWVENVKYLSKNPKTYTTQSGYSQVVPQVTMANKAKQDMLRYAQEFGFTPSARSNVGSLMKKDDVDPLEQILND